jgi:hypothetical protein
MVELKDLLEILKFQLSREIINLAKISLELLEKERDSRLKLEKLLIQAGFDDQELLNSERDYSNNRKVILDNFNTRKNEVIQLVEKFNVTNSKK